jgi:hypothetical protein
MHAHVALILNKSSWVWTFVLMFMCIDLKRRALMDFFALCMIMMNYTHRVPSNEALLSQTPAHSLFNNRRSSKSATTTTTKPSPDPIPWLGITINRAYASCPLHTILFTILTCAQRTHVHLCPQHWLLCHLGLY